ncbi:hypothetical protein [Xylanibacter muris]|jgi:hypothetical protein|uniref:hypothetical protein n=1 Tax=Bacteroidales TaxID=171549 RepID=UPI000FFF07CF|nr:hypothetical protein [Xylanibacter muris]RXE72193.1 hypothetical protein ED352_01700 [Muribaculaceae bacterium Isolate-002 (NCI)]
MAEEFDTNKQPGFHILISLIEIWKPKDKKQPNGDVDGEIMRICEVEEVEIDESFKKLISTASVRFPRGTIIRKTITNQTNEEEEDFKKVSVQLSNSGVVEETRTSTSVASPSTFSVGQRIKIYLGYTTDPQVAEMAKTGNTGKSIYNDTATYDDYLAQFKHTGSDSKKYMSLMFDGYITKVSLDTPIELECENLASFLRTITCPKVKLKKCEVKDFLGEDGRYKFLKDTGLILHPDTASMDFDLGAVELSTDLTVADVLTEWSKYGLFCYVSDYNGTPAIQIGRAYFSNPGKDSILNATTTPRPVQIQFDYHVANNGLGLTSSDKDFLAVGAKGIDSDDKFINITILRNPQFDSSKPESESNPAYRYVNETKLTKKAMKAGKRYLTDAPNDKVDMKLYTKIAFVSKTIPIDMKKLAEEAIKYLEGYNMTGIEGSLTLFGDLYIRTAQQVELIDRRYPGKNGVYLVEEVNTTFGTDGFRQRITLPYCIKRDGNNQSSQS